MRIVTTENILGPVPLESLNRSSSSSLPSFDLFFGSRECLSTLDVLWDFELDGTLREGSITVSGTLRLALFASWASVPSVEAICSSSLSRFRLFFFFFGFCGLVGGSDGVVALAFPFDAKMSSISDLGMTRGGKKQ